MLRWPPLRRRGKPPWSSKKRWENMVDLVGIEPTTSSMPWKRAPSCATGPLCLQEIPCGKGQLFNSRLDGRLSQTAANLRGRRSRCETPRSEREHVTHVAGLGVARIQSSQHPVPLNEAEDGNMVHGDVRHVAVLRQR